MSDRTAGGDRCPCGSGAAYERCCGPVHNGSPALTAETLMRARYTAYARGDEPFVLQTWHPDTRPAALRLDPAQTWIDLEILHCERGGVLDQEGVVAFAATFAEGGRTGLLEEVSRFVKVDRRWVYLDALDARLD